MKGTQLQTDKWREILGKIIKEPGERQRIANELRISPITLNRWVSGDSHPRPHNFQLLLQALPEHRKVLLEGMPQEVVALMSLEGNVEDAEQGIPALFYTRVLESHATVARSLHFSSISDLILLQALKHLDPNRVGMEITVVQCMPPSESGAILSLRESIGRGTPPWARELEQKTMFLGAESLAGYVVTTGRSRAIQNSEEEKSLFPAQWMEWEESAMACPLMRMNMVTGCLLVSCTQPDYFSSPVRQNLVQQYANLMSVLFDISEFHDLQKMSLRTMPPFDAQRPYLASFRRRVGDMMSQRARNHQPIGVMEAERRVWQEIEGELLQLSAKAQ